MGSNGRNGRPLFALFLITAVLAVWTFWPNTGHTPKLGLDLRGGTQVTLTPRLTTGTITDTQLNEAVKIIRQRVNGLGVAEAEVSTQGSGNNAAIIVSVPGVSEQGIADVLKQTALLDFRPVETEDAGAATVQSTEVIVCLLYTSPSPRDTERSRMPSSA